MLLTWSVPAAWMSRGLTGGPSGGGVEQGDEKRDSGGLGVCQGQGAQCQGQESSL